MATETTQTTTVKQPTKQEFKEEIKTEGPDGVQYETKYEYKVENKREVSTDPFSRIGRAEAIIQRSVMWSLGAGALPIPIVDILAITAVQIKMLKDLSDLYDVGFKASAAKKIIYSLLASLGSVGIGSAVGGTLAKLLPSIGTTIGVVSVPIFAGAFTHAVGKIFLMHFESGGTVLDFDPNAMRSYFKSEYERAREKVARTQKEEKVTTVKVG